MQLTTFLALAFGFATAATATPILASRQYQGVSIGVVVSPGSFNPGQDRTPIIELMPVQLNVITPCYGIYDGGCGVSELILQQGTATNVDENTVECQAYKDFEGTVKGSAAFNVNTPAYLSTNLATANKFRYYKTRTLNFMRDPAKL
ncbi:hypothetical protein G7Y89_g1260 [Cudoniella acicularis]|uniref:Uncharacterized protein n=1 Tax=Cudoniella acicularis TaxID=354080 RepID=A0A8H4RVM4_9HELO|nr:hypothetical protein G7Y89_g1260 [Cudoniella acicularis]